MSSQRCNNCGNKIKSHSSFGNTNNETKGRLFSNTEVSEYVS